MKFIRKTYLFLFLISCFLLSCKQKIAEKDLIIHVIGDYEALPSIVEINWETGSRIKAVKSELGLPSEIFSKYLFLYHCTIYDFMPENGNELSNNQLISFGETMETNLKARVFLSINQSDSDNRFIDWKELITAKDHHE